VTGLIVNKAKKVHPFKVIFGLMFLFLIPLIPIYFVNTQPTTNEDTLVPNIVGLSVSDAQRVLAHASLTPEENGNAYSEQVEPGKILSQWPEPGIKVKLGRTVSYVVAIGTIAVKVPDLTGLNYDQAEKMILAKGLVIGSIDQEGAGEPEVIQQYKIISQSPAPDTVVRSGSSINLTLEKKHPQPAPEDESEDEEGEKI
jgi:serine/threonine-protein kinase